MSREPKVRVRPWLTVGYVAEVVAGNGRVVCMTGPHLTAKGAEKAGAAASKSCKPVVKLVRATKDGD